MPTQRRLDSDFAIAESTSRERFALILSAWERVKDRAKPSPLVCTIARALLGWIHDGGGADGLQRSAADLAKRFDVKPHAIRKAFRLLDEAGLIEREARFRNDGSQAANVLRIRWEGVLAIAVYRDDPGAARPLSSPEQGAIPAGTGAYSDANRGPIPAGAPPLFPPERPLPTSSLPSSSAPATSEGAEGAAAAADDAQAREWEAARRELVEAKLTPPKAAEVVRQAKRDGYTPEEVRLLIGIGRDAIAAGKLRKAGAIAYRLRSPPGSPPLEGWPEDLAPPAKPRAREPAPTTIDPAERWRGALIRDLLAAGMNKPDAIAEADRRLAARTDRRPQEATA